MAERMLYPSYGTPYLPDQSGALGSLDLALNSRGGETAPLEQSKEWLGTVGRALGQGRKET